MVTGWAYVECERGHLVRTRLSGQATTCSRCGARPYVPVGAVRERVWLYCDPDSPRGGRPGCGHYWSSTAAEGVAMHCPECGKAKRIRVGERYRQAVQREALQRERADARADERRHVPATPLPYGFGIARPSGRSRPPTTATRGALQPPARSQQPQSAPRRSQAPEPRPTARKPAQRRRAASRPPSGMLYGHTLAPEPRPGRCALVTSRGRPCPDPPAVLVDDIPVCTGHLPGVQRAMARAGL